MFFLGSLNYKLPFSNIRWRIRYENRSKNSQKRNIKREIYTIISIILCTILITTFTTVITSVKKGIDESFAKENNDYHLMIKNINIEDLNKIKDEDFVDKIYIKDDKDESLKELVNEKY